MRTEPNLQIGDGQPCAVDLAHDWSGSCVLAAGSPVFRVVATLIVGSFGDAAGLPRKPEHTLLLKLFVDHFEVAAWVRFPRQSSPKSNEHGEWGGEWGGLCPRHWGPMPMITSTRPAPPAGGPWS